MTMRFVSLIFCACLFAGCAKTGQDRVALPLYVAGTAVTEPVIATGEVPITIERAVLAFGPLYLCAGTTAGELCETARLEWLESVVVDTLAVDPVQAGMLTGVTGTVQSWMYDLGISSQLTASEPYVLDAARQLDGASFVIEGRAIVDGIDVPFSASIPVQQSERTEVGVPVVRKSSSEFLFQDIQSEDLTLTLRFNPAAIVSSLDLRSYVTTQTCASDELPIVCDGTIERQCSDNIEVSNRDCGLSGLVCLPAKGCADRVVIDPDTEAYRSLRNALVGIGRPTFDWETP